MKGKGVLIVTVLVVLLGTAGLIYYFTSNSGGNDAVVETEKPELSDIVKKAVATGSVRPRQEVNVKPQVSGVVDEIYVEAGDLVEKGQKVAKIKLVPSEVSINNAKNSVELARLRYENAKRELARQREVYEQKLDVRDVQAGLDVARQQEQRYRELFEEGIISEQEYDQYLLDLKLAQTRYDNADILAKNNLKQFENDVEIRKQELDAAINNLQLLQEGASRNSRQVANVITSTVDGMVLDVPVEEGTSVIERNNFNEGTTIVTVADMNSLIFEGKVDESDVGELNEGMPLRISVGALPGFSFDAILEFISPKGVEEEGSVKFEVRAALKTPEEVFLRAGYSANADIILEQREQVLAINERDVLFEADTTFVEVRTGQEAFEKRPVALGLSDGVKVEVKAGLDSTSAIKVQQKL